MSTSILSAAVVSANGNSGPIKNDGSFTPELQVQVQCPQNATAGTTPQLVISLENSDDGVNFSPLMYMPIITGALNETLKQSYEPFLGEYARVSWTLPDPTASFPNVTITLGNEAEAIGQNILLNDTN